FAAERNKRTSAVLVGEVSRADRRLRRQVCQRSRRSGTRSRRTIRLMRRLPGADGAVARAGSFGVDGPTASRAASQFIGLDDTASTAPTTFALTRRPAGRFRLFSSPQIFRQVGAQSA